MKLKRPTMRDIARASGFSTMTVSFALRNDARVAPKTRERIHQVAAELGYRPDPEIVRLMHRVRNNRDLETVERVVVFNYEPDRETFARNQFTQTVIASAARRLDQHGFSLTEHWLGEENFDGAAVAKALHDQRVTGILIPPIVDDFPATFSFPWEEFTAISIEERPSAPRVHRVHPHHYNNMLQLLDKLWALGFRRIGFLSTRHMLGRDNYAWFGAFNTWGQQLHPERPFLPPLLEASEPVNLKRWFEQHRPDVLVVTAGWLEGAVRSTLGLDIPTDISLVSTGAEFDQLAGIDQQVEAIGQVAADLLMAHILRYEKGIPKHQKTVMVDGKWKEGNSYRTPRAAAGGK